MNDVALGGGGGRLLQRRRAGQPRFLSRFDAGASAHDGLLRELIPANRTYTYDAYGLPATGDAAATARLYAGEPWDASVGACYLRARWYLPEWGRFLSRDSYEGTDDDPVSQNRFLYTHANPVNNTDPTGHENLQSQVSVTGIQGVVGGLRHTGVAIVKRRGVRTLACIGAKRVLTSGPIHHIFTNKSRVRGERFTLDFERLFARGGLNLGDVLNKVILNGHFGPHPPEYHQVIKRMLERGRGSRQ